MSGTPLTVSELNSYLREVLEAQPGLADVWVLGEVTEFKRHSSGHCYFSLKHEQAVIKAVMWRSHALRTSLPVNGELVLTHGRVSFYEPRGDLQLYADMLMPAGVGMEQARFEELRQRLLAEGLFARKRDLPVLPRRIGIATAPTGAALRDMLQVLGRRCPLVEVVIAPCLVQGNQAPDSIVEALYQLYAANVDLVIVARGGGSAEDLWAFNDESVVRALFASPVPTITGVGHEVDTTMVDFVADLRAPTPSAAAELAVPELAVLAGLVANARDRLQAAWQGQIAERQAAIDGLSYRLTRLAPQARLDRDRQALDDLQRRMQRSLSLRLQLQKTQLQGSRDRLTALNPQAVLQRGYALVQQIDGQLVSRAASLALGTPLRLTFVDGTVTVDVSQGGSDE